MRSIPYQLILLSLLLVGCASYPTQELSDARQALQAAEEANAAQHAPIHLGKATKLLSSAEHALAPEKTSYATARTNALAAKKVAIKARELSLAFTSTIEELKDHALTTPSHNKANKLLQQAQDAAQAGDGILAAALVSKARAVIKKHQTTGTTQPH